MKKFLLTFTMIALSLSLAGCSSDGYSGTSNNNSYNTQNRNSITTQNSASQNTNINSQNDNSENNNAVINSEEPPVKKSSTGICHAMGSTYYNRTQNFTPFNSIEDCLNSGGRLPKR